MFNSKKKAAAKAAAAKAALASQFVDRFYQMDPATEDLISSGVYLQDGVVVLIEDHMVRESTNRVDEEYALERLRETNRWCTVSEVTADSRPEYDEDGSFVGMNTLVRFVATYEDGTKKLRRYNASYGWLVKLDSLPKAPAVEPEPTDEELAEKFKVSIPIAEAPASV